MQSLDRIKRRIRSIQTTSKITGAMKLVATAKMKRLMNQFKIVSGFCGDFYGIIENLAKTIQQNKSIKKTDGNKTLWILIGSSIGLCGAFNINVCKYLLSKIKSQDKVIVVGRRGTSYLKSRGYMSNIIGTVDFSDNNLDYLEMLPLCEEIITHFNDENFTAVNLVYTKFVNSLTFNPLHIQLLPFDSSLFKHLEDQAKIIHVDLDDKNREIEYEPNKTEILKNIIPTFIAASLFAAVCESRLCENGSRRNAMETATDNAKELIDELTLEFNDARQQNITQEINEIVAGADGSNG